MTSVLSALDAKKACPLDWRRVRDRAAVCQPGQALEERQNGDRDVGATIPDATSARGHRPVFVDDVVASGHTIDTAMNFEPLGLLAAGAVRRAEPMTAALIALLELGSLED